MTRNYLKIWDKYIAKLYKKCYAIFWNQYIFESYHWSAGSLKCHLLWKLSDGGNEKSFPQPEGAPFLISSRSIMHRDSCWHTNILIVGWPFHSHVLQYESRDSHHRTIKRGAPPSCGKTTLMVAIITLGCWLEAWNKKMLIFYSQRVKQNKMMSRSKTELGVWETNLG
jgi:hypothetical protein